MNPQCEHTLYHADRQGRLQGSWAEELVVDTHLGQRVRIVCGSCGKFHGYLRDGTSRVAAVSLPATIQDAPERPADTQEHESLPNRVQPVDKGHEPIRPTVKLRRGGIDYKELRHLVSMGNVLDLIGYQPTSTQGDQVRGPCPVHASTTKRSRSFSADLRGSRYQCFNCHAKGNQLDLWVAVSEMPLYEAALDLCDKMQIEPPWST